MDGKQKEVDMTTHIPKFTPRVNQSLTNRNFTYINLVVQKTDKQLFKAIPPKIDIFMVLVNREIRKWSKMGKKI